MHNSNGNGITVGHLIEYAVANHPDLVCTVNFTGLVRRAKVKRRRVDIGGSRAVGLEYGQIIAEVPALVARNLQLPVDERDLMVLIHVPREVANEAYERLTSVIITPNGNSSLIVPPQ